jgi:thioesterase
MIRLGLRTYTCPRHAPVRVVILPHAGGSASYFRNWGPVADNLGVELCAVQYPGHEELFTATRASSLDELAKALVTVIGDQAERTVLFGHSMGGLLAHRVTQFLVAEDNPPQALHVSATRAPDQPVAAPRHILDDRALVSSIGEMSPGEENPLENEDLAAVLLDQVRSEMRLAETHRCEPTPLPLPITLHLATEDPDFTLADVSAWDRFTTRGTHLITHPGHHFYLSTQQATVLRAVMENLPTTSPSGK